MRKLVLSTLTLALLGCQDTENTQVQQATPAPAVAAAEQVPIAQLPDWEAPSHYSLTLWVNPDQQSFKGEGEIAMTLSKASDHLWMHAKDMSQLQIQAQTQDGELLDAKVETKDDSGVIKVSFAKVLEPQKLTLKVTYQAPYNQSLEGLYKVSEGGRNYAFTQFESIDARRAFPGFDEPRFKVPFDITLAIPKGMKAVANTPEVSRKEEGDWTYIQYATTKPLPSYLLAFAVGDLDIVDWQPMPKTALRDHAVPLRGVAVHGKGEKLKYALEHSAGIVQTLEDYFGIPYPYKKLDIIAVPDFAAGAMENPGAITYREQLLLMDEDAPFWQKRSYASVHAHELAHQWFGDLVTMPWWTDIWLNEAFATWAGNKAAATWAPDWGYDLGIAQGAQRAMSADSLVNMREIRQPILSNADISNAFDGITYQKGGAVLKMFEYFVGPKTFQKGVHQHLVDHAWGNATAEDFVGAIAKAANNPAINHAFMTFLTQTGVPKVAVETHCEDGKASLHLTQSRYLPLGSKGDPNRTWDVPFCFSADGQRHCQLLTEKETDIPLAHCPKTLLPNADGTGYYRFSVSDWQPLVAALPTLPKGEALAVLDSFNAALADGSLSVDDYLAQMPTIAQLKDRELATAPMDQLTFILEHQSQDKDARRAQYQAWYGPRLATLGLATRAAESKDDTLLRNSLVYFLAETAKAPLLRAQLGEAAKAYMAGKPSGISPDLTGLALDVWVQDTGRPAFEALKAQLAASEDSVVRQRAVQALASTEEPQLSKEVLDMALTGPLRVNERFMIMGDQAYSDRTRAATYDWFKANRQAVEAMWPAAHRKRIVSAFSGFCSDEMAKDLADYFGKLNYEGGERNLKGAVESIELCSARAKG
ncbi:M1 family metallopeptidase [Gallaecimonas kandeliae]|uniref:M1 family metallopeptidase n=1 Tax=Gallaecimonas kandeliae TaxID=3029055 RepID=UPI00264755C9|nr:M1 family metallopeptidase [Gallaecimonas kandeliae]WKE66945.1 M1 family metallopeptidase [Gallaecimonas kandeliae]